MKIQNRRLIFKKMFAGLFGLTGISIAANATTKSEKEKVEKEVFNVQYDEEIPLFSGSTKFGGMVFVAGKGAHPVDRGRIALQRHPSAQAVAED